ncbi:hypothetical protein RAS1_11370 [Phycisphaerae bacterium RAS1]|nr:hypothetical protein RAS1_11370 [Phycisphaerae bacterium RAS1]
MSRFGRYLRAAFLYRWNLLVFLGAAGFAMVSGKPDVWVPVVAAGELAFLGLLATHGKFQRAVDAQAAKATRAEAGDAAESALQRIMKALPPRSLARFELLRSRCLDLRQIAAAIKEPEAAPPPVALEAVQLAGLDRLLWIFLRLLFTEHSLARFLERLNEGQIEGTISEIEHQLKNSTSISDEIQRQRVQKTLQDNLETCRDRLANYRKARDNYEFVKLELNRLENKIATLAELAVSRQEPDYITTQVDQVAQSMLQTERTMNDLQFATGLAVSEEAAPELMQREVIAGSARR